MMINLRAFHILLARIELTKLADMVGFHQKIHFLLGNPPHFVENRRNVENAPLCADDLHQSRRTLQEDNILLHHIVNVGPLNFYDHILARRQDGAMHLRDRSRA